MPSVKEREELKNILFTSITNTTSNTEDKELVDINDSFSKSLTDVLNKFNSNIFDDDGFIKKMSTLTFGDSGTGNSDKDMLKKLLRGVSRDYLNGDTVNQSEILLRRDLASIAAQMPEMKDALAVVRDSIIECNVSTGEVSRSLIFENKTDDSGLETQVKDVENKYNLLVAIKNFIIPNTLKNGEMYVQVVPYSKLFAELDMLNSKNRPSSYSINSHSHSGEVTLNESVDNSLYNEDNVKTLMESLSIVEKDTIANNYETSNDRSIGIIEPSQITEDNISSLLKNINVYNHISPVIAENGAATYELLKKEYKNTFGKWIPDPKTNAFLESFSYSNINTGMNGDIFADLDQDDIDTKKFANIKGCYVKYLDSLKIVPIRIDRRIIGYYYVTTTNDMNTNSVTPNGMIDLSYQQFTRNRNTVNELANLIINSFDKSFLNRNIQLKNEIAEIIMAHKFQEGRLSFIYIPENEVVRMVINEDENGKGHSIMEPSIFQSRNYLMLTMYNMITILNNTTTRIHYIRSSGLDKNLAAQVQRVVRKFSQRRITMNDIYSYTGVISKVGGMGEMVLPQGRNDYKAIETDTIPAMDQPVSADLIEQYRRQAINGMGVPNLLVINAIDEVDFAKTLEMANTRFLSTISSYKIDFNKGITELYQRLLHYNTEMTPEEITSFKFKFNEVKSSDLNITNEMIANYNTLVETVSSLYYTKTDMEDENGNATPKQILLKKKLAEKYIPQLDFDELDEIVDEVNTLSVADELQQRANNIDISDEEIDEVENSDNIDGQ